MSRGILILGETGTGKSTSIRELDPLNTFIIQCKEKDLPFRPKGYSVVSKENPTGNVFQSDDADKIMAALKRVDNFMPHITTVIIDDFQYVMSDKYFGSANKSLKGNQVFDLYKEIGYDAWQILNGYHTLRKDLTIIILSHSEKTDDGKYKMKTIGRMLDEKGTPEGLFTIVLHTHVVAIEKGREMYFNTNDGFKYPSKSPLEMFDLMLIPNDLQYVINKVNEYYNPKESEKVDA